MAKTMAFSQVAGIVLAVHTDEPPSSRDWDAYCEFGRGLPANCNRYLVVTDGGGPDARQRAQTVEILKARGQPDSMVAVVTRGTIVRGIVTALGWFNPRIKTFLPEHLDAAMTYLGVAPAQAPQIKIELKVLQAELRRKSA